MHAFTMQNCIAGNGTYGICFLERELRLLPYELEYGIAQVFF